MGLDTPSAPHFRDCQSQNLLWELTLCIWILGCLTNLSIQTIQIAGPEKKMHPSNACHVPRIWYILALQKVICFWIDIVLSCSPVQWILYCLHVEFPKSCDSSAKFHFFFICQIHSIALICHLSGSLNFNESLNKCTQKTTDQLSLSLMFQKKSNLNQFFQIVPGKPYSCYWGLFLVVTAPLVLSDYFWEIM